MGSHKGCPIHNASILHNNQTLDYSPVLLIVHVKPAECLVYPGTSAQARELIRARLARTDLPPVVGWQTYQIREALRARPEDNSLPYVVPASEPVRALHEVASANVGAMSIALATLSRARRTPGSAVLVTEAWKHEYATWLLRTMAGAGPKRWDASTLNKWHPERQLSFFAGLRERAGGRRVSYVDDREVQAVTQLAALLRDPGGAQSDEEALRPALRWLNAQSPPQEAFLLGQGVGERPTAALPQ